MVLLDLSRLLLFPEFPQMEEQGRRTHAGILFQEVTHTSPRHLSGQHLVTWDHQLQGRLRNLIAAFKEAGSLVPAQVGYLKHYVKPSKKILREHFLEVGIMEVIQKPLLQGFNLARLVTGSIYIYIVGPNFEWQHERKSIELESKNLSMHIC